MYGFFSIIKHENVCQQTHVSWNLDTPFASNLFKTAASFLHHQAKLKNFIVIKIDIEKIQRFYYFASRFWWLHLCFCNPLMLLFIILSSLTISYTCLGSDLISRTAIVSPEITFLFIVENKRWWCPFHYWNYGFTFFNSNSRVLSP